MKPITRRTANCSPFATLASAARRASEAPESVRGELVLVT